jgi:hypothetical protein
MIYSIYADYIDLKKEVYMFYINLINWFNLIITLFFFGIMYPSQESGAGSVLLGTGYAEQTAIYNSYYYNIFNDFHKNFPKTFYNLYQHAVNDKSLLLEPGMGKILARYHLLNHQDLLLSNCLNDKVLAIFTECCFHILKNHEQEWYNSLYILCINQPHLFCILHEYIDNQSFIFTNEDMKMFKNYQIIRQFSNGLYFFNDNFIYYFEKYYESIVQKYEYHRSVNQHNWINK